jgi:hypothetical protein
MCPIRFQSFLFLLDTPDGAVNTVINYYININLYCSVNIWYYLRNILENISYGHHQKTRPPNQRNSSRTHQCHLWCLNKNIPHLNIPHTHSFRLTHSSPLTSKPDTPPSRKVSSSYCCCNEIHLSYSVSLKHINDLYCKTLNQILSYRVTQPTETHNKILVSRYPNARFTYIRPINRDQVAPPKTLQWVSYHTFTYRVSIKDILFIKQVITFKYYTAE